MLGGGSSGMARSLFPPEGSDQGFLSYASEQVLQSVSDFMDGMRGLNAPLGSEQFKPISVSLGASMALGVSVGASGGISRNVVDCCTEDGTIIRGGRQIESVFLAKNGGAAVGGGLTGKGLSASALATFVSGSTVDEVRTATECGGSSWLPPMQCQQDSIEALSTDVQLGLGGYGLNFGGAQFRFDRERCVTYGGDVDINTTPWRIKHLGKVDWQVSTGYSAGAPITNVSGGRSSRAGQ
jgi:hypothetical protein